MSWFWLFACDAAVDTAGERLLLSDDDVIAISLTPSFTPLYVAAKADAVFEWSAVTTDWLGQPFDAASETQTVEFILGSALSAEDLALALVRDNLTQEMVALYGWEVDHGPYQSAQVSEFEDHTPQVRPSDLVPGQQFLLLLRDASDTIRLAILVEGSESISATGETYAITDGMSTLDASAALDAAPVLLGDGDQIDWHQLTASSTGGAFDSANVTFVASVSLAASGRMAWSDLASTLASADSVPTGGEVKVDTPLPIASAAAGERFLVALDCDNCEPIFPTAIFIAERE